MDDCCDMAATADCQQQSPGEQCIGVELNSLRVQGGSAAIFAYIGAGEKALKALHGGINVLKGRGGERGKIN